MEILTPEQIAALTPDQQIAYYKGLYEAETAAHGTTQGTLTQAQNDLATAQTDLTSEQAAHEQTKTDASDEVGKMSAQLANVTKAAAQGYVSVEIGDKNYKVIGKRFQIDGKVVSVDDLIKDADALQKLVALKSGILVALD